jgi:4-hydroxybenzoate polyprenyltransferase
LESIALRRILPYLRLADPSASVLIIGLTTLLFGYLVALPWLEAVLLALSFVILTAILNSVNAITDVQGDRVSRPHRPLPLGTVSERQAWLFVTSNSLAALAAFWALSAVRSAELAVMALTIDAGLIFAYSLRPIRLKTVPFAGSLSLIAHFVVLPLFAAWALAESGIAFPVALLVFLILNGWATATVEDFGDVAGDRVLGDWTVPAAFGTLRAKMVALVTYASAAVLAIAFWSQNPSRQTWLTPLPLQGALIVLALLVNRDPERSRRIYALSVVFSFLAGMIVVLDLAQTN